MKYKEDITNYIKNFDDEVENKSDWLNIHINLMFNELCDVQNTIIIFKVVENEWNRRAENGEKIDYSAIRTILFESLPYKIVLGLSKILVGETEYSLLKTINMISQMQEYKNNKEIKELIVKIRDFLSTSELVNATTVYRDKFFAHLDKVSVVSECRFDSTVALKAIDVNEVNDCATLVNALYEACFGVKLNSLVKEFVEKDILYTFFWMSTED